MPDAAAAPLAGNPPPSYPPAARRAGKEGRTVLRVVVARTGECREVGIVKSSGTPSLDQAAVTAVRQWRFSPAIEAGRSVEAVVDIPITFRLAERSL